MQAFAMALAPLRRITRPLVLGVDRIPARPVLFVGNHTRYGLLDLPFMVDELWTWRRIMARGLGDHGHYRVPFWRDLLTAGGMVRGTRDNVRTLMRQGENILVFPGGAGEVVKGRGKDYQLLWKERLGFAKMAAEFGYPIVPFAAVGAEEMYDVVLDHDMLPAPLAKLIERSLGFPLPPISRGIGPTVVPRPQRLYFWFGDAIDTVNHDGLAEEDFVRRVRDETKSAVQNGIEILLATRAAAPKRRLMRKTVSATAGE